MNYQDKPMPLASLPDNWPNWHDRNIVINNNTVIVNNRGPQVWTPDPGPRRHVSRPGGREAFAREDRQRSASSRSVATDFRPSTP